MRTRLRILVALTSVFLILGCATEPEIWIHPSGRKSQLDLNQDDAYCTSKAQSESSGVSNAATDATGSAASLGGYNAGLSQMVLGLAMVQVTQRRHWERCMSEIGWRQKDR